MRQPNNAAVLGLLVAAAASLTDDVPYGMRRERVRHKKRDVAARAHRRRERRRHKNRRKP